MSDREATAIGVFIFAGGFTLGTKRAGFRVLGQLEDGPYGVATTRANHPDVPVHSDRDAWPLADYVGRVDYVYGNPPCAPFSNAGVSPLKVGMMGDWWKADPRAECIMRMFTVLEVVRPQVWAWESVQPALKRGRPLIDELTAAAAALGYSASYVLINAAHLGVPQVRRRFFCVFHKVAIPWSYPPPHPLLTVRDAWMPLTSGAYTDPGTISHARKRHIEMLATTPAGASLRKAWEAEHPPETWQKAKNGVKDRPGFVYSRLDWDKPSPVLLGGPTKYHPDEARFITLMEQQLLCGYPPEYQFVGKTTENKIAQTAQAVMPPVGEWLGRNVMAAIRQNIPADPGAQIVDLESSWRVAAPAPVRARATTPPSSDNTRASAQPKLPEQSSRPAVASRPLFEPARPRQLSSLPMWETYSGPTELARVLIAEGHEDGPILAATTAAIVGARAVNKPWPKWFTPRDLRRLRERIGKEKD